MLFSYDGRHLWALVQSPASFDVFDAKTGLCLAMFRDIGHQSGLSVFCLDPDGRFYFTGGSDGIIGVWKYPSLTTNKPNIIAEELQKFYGHSEEIKGIFQSLFLS